MTVQRIYHPGAGCRINDSFITFICNSKSMLKVMDGELLNAAKRTVQATKLSEDELIEVIPIDWMEGSEDKVVLQTKEGVFLKFLLSEIPKRRRVH